MSGKWMVLLIFCISIGHICSLYIDPIVARAGPVHEAAAARSLSVSPDWCFNWRSFTRMAPQDAFAPALYHVSPDDPKLICSLAYFKGPGGVKAARVWQGRFAKKSACLCLLAIYLFFDACCVSVHLSPANL